jgi:Ca2+-binding RTX toxin-like protein
VQPVVRCAVLPRAAPVRDIARDRIAEDTRPFVRAGTATDRQRSSSRGLKRRWYSGNDTLNRSGDTGPGNILGLAGDDSILTGSGLADVAADSGNDIIILQTGDTIITDGGADTNFGGLGNDVLVSGDGRDTLQGNEGNDPIDGGQGIDTIAGGGGSDLFDYTSGYDGENAAGGGPVECITDVDFATDRLDIVVQVTFAANVGAGTGGTLAASAGNAIAATFAIAGGGNAVVAARFTFAGRTYLTVDQFNHGTFFDPDDLLIDITGATGAITATSFI